MTDRPGTLSDFQDGVSGNQDDKGEFFDNGDERACHVSRSVRLWSDSRALTNQSQSSYPPPRPTEANRLTSVTKRTQMGGGGRCDRPKPIRLPSGGHPSDQTKPPIRSGRFRSVTVGNRADSGTSGSRSATDRSQFGVSEGGSADRSQSGTWRILTDRSQSGHRPATKRTQLGQSRGGVGRVACFRWETLLR
jgi:hypothetical protein